MTGAIIEAHSACGPNLEHGRHLSKVDSLLLADRSRLSRGGLGFDR